MFDLKKIEFSSLRLSKHQRFAGLAALVGLTCLSAWIFIYAPILKKIKFKTSECLQIEEKASQARGIATTSRGGQKRLTLVRENEASKALNEITLKGKEAGINFVSITPHPVQKSPGSELKILPIELETKSLYKAVGVFLGELQSSESIFSTVHHFEIKTEPSNPALISARILLYVYLAD